MSKIELLQRAIHSAKCRIYRINYDLNCDISLNHQRKAENQKELMEITVDALKKQMPKKPIENRYPWAICSVCGGSIYLENVQEHIQNKENTYCEHCGQAIDWSDTE